MSDQMSLPHIPSATSSQELESGATPSDKQGGQTIDRSGQDLALANLSARQAKEAGLLTSGTYGPRGIGSLPKTGRPSSSGSKSHPPLFGNVAGKKNGTHWIAFMKPDRET